jgi:hypothetical protein
MLRNQIRNKDLECADRGVKKPSPNMKLGQYASNFEFGGLGLK